MKIKAMSMAEVIIAMTMVTVLAIIGIRSFKANVPDGELIKFKQAYATTASVVGQMLQDKEVFATNLADTLSVTVRRTGQTYEGESKFRTVFIDKLNVLRDLGNVDEGAVAAPLLSRVGGNLIQGSSEHCVLTNKGITFCVPDIVIPANELELIYIRLHINKEFDPKKAVYLGVYPNGKIIFPAVIGDYIDCTDREKTSFVSTNNGEQEEIADVFLHHCRIISAMEDM